MLRELVLPAAPRVAPPPVAPAVADEFRSAVAHVAAGHCQRICMPGRWVVWMPEGAAKPHARIFENPTQEAALCKCS